MATISDSELDGIFKSGVTESYYAGLRACWLAGYETGKAITLTSDTSSSGITETPVDAVPTIATP